MASITKTAKGYRAQISVKGRRDSASFRTKREAASWASELEIKLHSGEHDPQKPVTHTLGEALSKYGEEVSPTKKGEAFELKRMTAWEKDENFPSNMNIAEIEPEHISKWRDIRLKTVSSGAVLRDFTLLGPIFETARREWRWIKTNPIRDVRKPRQPDHRNTTITRSQIRKMLESLGYHPGKECRTVSQSVAGAFLLALRTGMRAKEICNLTHDRIRADYCILLDTKTTPRDVPLTSKAVRIIKNMGDWDDLHVFGLKAQTLDAMFRKYRDRAGMHGMFTFHDSRHTAATWLARKVDNLTLCKIFGWKSTSMALIYYNPTASDITKMIEPTKPDQSR
ncbi:tyrosine-type recombinase/integrase [Propionivibrio sp.]|uniref:tyrosine-type recombinase/integrase n=1 Tax=Propionivibrio sp. TaxID=2212460 RepID=UPI003BF319C0